MVSSDSLDRPFFELTKIDKLLQLPSREMTIIVWFVNTQQVCMESWMNPSLLKPGGEIQQVSVIVIVLHNPERTYKFRNQFSSAVLGQSQVRGQEVD
jgi:hypothetical protein